MVRRYFSLKAAAICAATFSASLPAAFAQQQQAASLPNGASSLQETYQDWQLACVIQDNARVCTVTQDQTQKNGQRLLAVELRAAQKGGLIGTLLLPFGILFDPGVAAQIDDQPPVGPLKFRTCLPNGCVALFPIDRALMQKLKAGTELKLDVTTAAETPLSFPVSLKGLGAALDRMVALSAR
ncbi:MAG: invasion associated locus B family protein [Mesorhizobium sp.]|uniref:invasion associated locus B family protein n=1 Tax=Mesorhizobium sp. TaxID=1871066 RepID=UPI000FE9DA40|nr:invasion associated locus B family protein [Mesorhizobium sp.]RWC89867.1 MAG: invasion associated locus B family protein [Mesorhizobium sp.]